MTAIDITAKVFNALTPGDHVGLTVESNTSILYVLGVMIEYTI